MPNRGTRILKGGPRAYLEPGEQWPDGTKVEGCPTSVYWAAEISRRLTRRTEGLVRSSVTSQAGLARSTLYDLMNGTTWPDLQTVLDLEDVLGAEILPRWARGHTTAT